jgi:hypothetical protein
LRNRYKKKSFGENKPVKNFAKNPGDDMKKINPLAIAIFIFIIAAMTIAIFSIKRKDDGSFQKEKAALAAKLYGEIKETDFENAYPQTPEDLIEINNKILFLIYGDMLADEKLVEEIVSAQRKMFSKELLELNSYESQLSKLILNLERLDELDTRVISVEVGAVKYFGDSAASASVTEYLSPNGQATFEFNLIKENGLWKINSWF